jgi:hypothetical protein
VGRVAVCTNTIMRGEADRRQLASEILSFAEELRR